MNLAENIHQQLPLPPGVSPENAALVRGSYSYFHYGCDAFDDRGWGCGYRTLQTLCSWVYNIQTAATPAAEPVSSIPSLTEIQETLVRIGDKPASMVGSRDWIGSVEVGMVLDTLYDVPCKILHVPSGPQLEDNVEELFQHFKDKAAPIMMGGNSDAASKGILGICSSEKNHFLLILDPHYWGPCPSHPTLVEHNMLSWRPLSSFMEHSFYNLCLPQYSSLDRRK